MLLVSCQAAFQYCEQCPFLRVVARGCKAACTGITRSSLLPDAGCLDHVSREWAKVQQQADVRNRSEAGPMRVDWAVCRDWLEDS